MKNGCKDFASPTMNKIKIDPYFENRLHDITFAQTYFRVANSRGDCVEDTVNLTEELYRYIIYLYQHIEQLEKDKRYLLVQMLKEKHGNKKGFSNGGNYMETLMAKLVTREDIDLLNKLSNMTNSEISEEIYDKCVEEETFAKIENKVWELLSDTSSRFSQSEYYDGLAREYEPIDDHDYWTACLYNCDLIYMVAIAMVLDLEIPKTSCDVGIFGL